MTVYPFYQVDAFTDQPLQGNPCAVFLDSDNLDEPVMLAIAREMNLSESAFVRRSAVADFGVRYFTPAEEIPLAGHPTLAVARALVDSGRMPLSVGSTWLSLELVGGPIRVEVQAAEGKIERIMMTQRQPQFLSVLDPRCVLPVFGLNERDLLEAAPVQIVSTGTPQLMIPLRGLEPLWTARIDVEAYLNLREQTGFFSPHLFCLQGVTPAGQTFARHFGVPPDSPEDPFTGSATGGMAAYLWHYGFIDKPTFIAEQGHWMQHPGQAFVEIEGPRQAIKSVRVGGSTITVLRGELIL